MKTNEDKSKKPAPEVQETQQTYKKTKGKKQYKRNTANTKTGTNMWVFKFVGS